MEFFETDINDYNFAIGWNILEFNDSHLKNIAVNISKLKIEISSAPIRHIFMSILNNNKYHQCEDFRLEYSFNKCLYVIPKNEEINIIFRITDLNQLNILLIQEIANELEESIR